MTSDKLPQDGEEAEAVPAGPPSWQTARTSPLDYHVGARIRRARTERGLSMAKLGQAIGVSTGQIQKYERAENAIIPSRLHDIARVLQVYPGWFFEDFEPDIGLVFDTLAPDPVRPSLTSDVADLAYKIMELDRPARKAVQTVVEQMLAAAGKSGDGVGAPANEAGPRRTPGAAE